VNPNFEPAGRPCPGWRLFCAAAGAIAWACGPATPLPPGTENLLAPAHRPLLIRESGAIHPPDSAFLSGFRRPERHGSERWIWAREGPARIALGFVSARPRTLEFEASALALPGAPALEVEAFLDGSPIGSFLCARGRRATYRLPIPEALSVVGLHTLELHFDGVVARREDLPGSRGRRRLTMRLWALRILPLVATAEPGWRHGELHLPCGTRALWTRWIPEGARLRSLVRTVGVPAKAARFVLATEEEAGRVLEGPNPALEMSGPARLELGCPAGVKGRIVVRKLTLAAPPERRETQAAPPRPAKVVMVIGRLAEGFLVTPCSTDRERALRCLLSGQEAAAFGFEAPLAVDFIGRTAAEVADFLTASEPSVIAVLRAPDEPAEVNAEAVRARVPGVSILLTSLPGKEEEIELWAQVVGFHSPLANASHLDFLPTAYSMAGRPPLPRFSGIDLGPALRGAVPTLGRPVAALWDADRSVAVTASRMVQVSANAEPVLDCRFRSMWRPSRGRGSDLRCRPGADLGARPTVTEEFLVHFLTERRRVLAWLAP